MFFLLFKADGVWDALKANMVAIILDGASVNLGSDKGIAKRFQDALKPRHITVVHCANHRFIFSIQRYEAL